MIGRASRTLVGAVLTCLPLGACTTNETDPAKVGWGDLLWGRDRLNAHVEGERARLDGRLATRDTLRATVDGHRATLGGLDDDLTELRQEILEASDGRGDLLAVIDEKHATAKRLDEDAKELNERAGEIPPKELVEETLRIEREVHLLRVSIAKLQNISAIRALQVAP
ncbi:MAG: hypothetical protein ACF8XB_04095 [Planctomycetota bacterium JB042]